MALTTHTLTGRIYQADNVTPEAGSIILKPGSGLLVDAASGNILAGTATVPLADDGSYTLTLATTDNPGTQPEPNTWNWSVEFRLHNSVIPPFAFALPTGSTATSLAGLARVAPAPGTYVVVPGPPGAPGAAGTATLSGSGAPASSTGTDGDFYIDTADYPDSATFYGPKTGGAWPGSGVAVGGAAGALIATNDLSDLSSAAAARANLGLGTAAVAAATAFDAAGAAGAAESTAVAAAATDAAAKYRRKPPWQFDITAYGAVGDAVLVHDGATTAGVATLTCATSAPFTADMVGMSVLIQGAGPAGITAFTTTFSGYDGPASMTLAAAPPTAITNAVVVFGTNNYAAIRAAAAAAEKYLQGTGTGVSATPHTYAQVYTPPGAYILDGPLDTSLAGNGQIPLGEYPTTDVKRIPHFAGDGSGAGVRHWEQLVPQYGGSCWISFGFYTGQSVQRDDINANGNPGIISGPNEGTSNGLAYGASSRFTNLMPMITGMAFLLPHTADGFPYGAANLYGCANAHIEDVSISTLGVVAVGSDYTSPGVFGTGLSIGALMPAPGNNDLSLIRNLSIQGGFTYGLFFSEHTLIDRVMVLYCWAGLCPVGTYAGSVGAAHAMKITQASIEQCPREVYVIGPGSEGVGPRIDIDQLQTESGTPTIDGNSTAALAAAEGRITFTGLFTKDNVNAVQPTGIEAIDGQAPRAIRLETADHTATMLDRTILMDTTAGPLTLHLPNADYNPVEYVAKNIGANTLTVAALASPQQHIVDSAQVTSIALAAGEVARLQAKYNGIEWQWYRL